MCNYQAGDIITLFIPGLIETNTIWNDARRLLEENNLSYVLLGNKGQDGSQKHIVEFNADSILAGAKKVITSILDLVGKKQIKIHCVGHSLGSSVCALLAGDPVLKAKGILFERVTMLAPAFETKELQRIQIPKFIFDQVGKQACLTLAGNAPKVARWLGNITVARMRALSFPESEHAKSELLFHRELPSEKICEAIDLSNRSKAILPSIAWKTDIVFAKDDGLVEEPGNLHSVRSKTRVPGGHLIPLNNAPDVLNNIVKFALSVRKK